MEGEVVQVLALYWITLIFLAILLFKSENDLDKKLIETREKLEN